MAGTLADEDIQRLFKALRKVSFFSAIPVKNIDRIIDQFRKREFGKGEKIIRQGKPGEAFYVIKTGSCLVYKSAGLFSKEDIAVLREDDIFGEMSLVYDSPTTASVMTLEPSVIFSIHRHDFMHVMEDSPEAFKQITAIAEERKSK